MLHADLLLFLAQGCCIRGIAGGILALFLATIITSTRSLLEIAIVARFTLSRGPAFDVKSDLVPVRTTTQMFAGVANGSLQCSILFRAPTSAPIRVVPGVLEVSMVTIQALALGSALNVT